MRHLHPNQDSNFPNYYNNHPRIHLYVRTFLTAIFVIKYGFNQAGSYNLFPAINGSFLYLIYYLRENDGIWN
jgi:hypothetical protein